MIINKISRQFKNIFLLIFLLETLSFLSFNFSFLSNIIFWLLVVVFTTITFLKFEYGLLIVFAELFISSKGYLFYYEADGFNLSIRIAFFGVIFLIWLWKIINSRSIKKIVNNFLKIENSKYFIILFIFISWGVVNALLNNNTILNIYKDFNAWLYFWLIFPLSSLSYLSSDFNKSKFDKKLLNTFLASVFWLSVKSFILLYIFSHKIMLFIPKVYKWIRDTGVGEITIMQDGFVRIFFQSHIFVIVAIFAILLILQRAKNKNTNLYYLLFGIFFATTILSYSRSNWIGIIAGFIFYIFILLMRKSFLNLRNFFYTIFIGIFISIIIITGIIYFPFPSSQSKFSISNITDRATKITNEAGVSSRWRLLPVLWQEILKAPILGQGFGTALSYYSEDPRIIKQSNGGKYTTFSFEWGWLDIWLKLGLFGMLAYLIVIFKIININIRQLKQEFSLSDTHTIIKTSAILSIIVLSVIHIFSPYLNHPLGIGLLLLSNYLLYSQELAKK